LDEDDVQTRPLVIHLSRKPSAKDGKNSMNFICSFDFKYHEIITLQGIPDLDIDVFVRPEQLSISACREWSENKESAATLENCYVHYYQVSVHLPEHHRVKILQYRMEYTRQGRGRIRFVGASELIMRCPGNAEPRSHGTY
jgi:HSP20 family molecular chaperone IbpA